MPVVIDLEDGEPVRAPPLHAAVQRTVCEISSDTDDLPDVHAPLARGGRLQEAIRDHTLGTSHAPDTLLKHSRLLSALGTSAAPSNDLPHQVDKGKRRALSPPSETGSASAASDSETLSTSEARRPAQKRSRLTEGDKIERERSKADAKQRKAQEREAKKVQAAIDKQLKKDEKAANTLSRGRTEEIHDLRIMFSHSLADLPTFKPIMTTVTDQLRDDRIKAVETFRSPDDIRVIRWRRDCLATWDPTTRMFKLHENNEVRVEDEPTILMYIKAVELSTIEDLLGRVALARRVHGGANVQVFLLVDGIAGIRRKQKAAENQALRARLDGRTSPTKQTKTLSTEEIELALMRVQMTEKCHILQPKTINDVIRWIVEITKDIGARRKRLVEKSHLERLGIDGQRPREPAERNNLKAGYRNMLSAMFRVDEGTAISISRTYPTMRKLYEAYERLPSQAAREQMLVGTPKLKNADGSASNKALGSAGSKRIYTQLFDRDPSRVMAKMTAAAAKKRAREQGLGGDRHRDDDEGD